MGCPILDGAATAFYYVDYDEDAKDRTVPAFGLFDSHGNPTLDTLNCSTWKPDMRTKDYENLPGFMGVSQVRRQNLEKEN